MGLIKSGAFLAVSFILLITLIMSNIFFTVYLSSSSQVFSETMEKNSALESIVNESFDEVESHCENNSEYTFSYNGNEIEVPCDKTNNTQFIIYQLKNSTQNQSAEGCNSLGKCIFNLENAIDYQGAMDYSYGKTIFFIILSLILFIPLFLLIEKRINFPITAGTLILISSLPSLAISKILPYFDFQILGPLILLLSESATSFMVYFFSGILMITLGVGFRFYNLGYWLSKKFDSVKEKRNSSSETKSD